MIWKFEKEKEKKYQKRWFEGKKGSAVAEIQIAFPPSLNII